MEPLQQPRPTSRENDPSECQGANTVQAEMHLATRGGHGSWPPAQRCCGALSPRGCSTILLLVGEVSGLHPLPLQSHCHTTTTDWVNHSVQRFMSITSIASVKGLHVCCRVSIHLHRGCSWCRLYGSCRGSRLCRDSAMTTSNVLTRRVVLACMHNEWLAPQRMAAILLTRLPSTLSAGITDLCHIAVPRFCGLHHLSAHL